MPKIATAVAVTPSLGVLIVIVGAVKNFNVLEWLIISMLSTEPFFKYAYAIISLSPILTIGVSIYPLPPLMTFIEAISNPTLSFQFLYG